jgi:hypothetical protein
MKKISLCVALLAASTILSAQVAFGTDKADTNLILKINSKPAPTSMVFGGILFPRVALSSASNFAPVTGTPANGLMVYNINTSGSDKTRVFPGLYYWSTTDSQWHRAAQNNSNETALFANQNTTTDLNSEDGIFADIFANVRFNNNTTLYEKVNATTLKINETGVYKVILNLDLQSSGGADNFGIELVVNGAEDIVSENIYVPGRWDSEDGKESNFPNGRSFLLYVPINTAGHTIRLRTYAIDPNTDVRFKNSNTSTISLEKIR